jgi:hypothetical protein
MTLMSVSPEPPERLAEILLEILALSKPTQASQSESARGVIQSNHATRIALNSSRNGETKKITSGKDYSASPRVRVRIYRQESSDFAKLMRQ